MSRSYLRQLHFARISWDCSRSHSVPVHEKIEDQHRLIGNGNGAWESHELSPTRAIRFLTTTPQGQETGNITMESGPGRPRKSPSMLSNTFQKPKAKREEPEQYDVPDSYVNLNEVAGPSLDQNPDGESLNRHSTLERTRSRHDEPDQYDVPDSYVNLDEVAGPSPVQNPDENQLYRHLTLERSRTQEQQYFAEQAALKIPRITPKKGIYNVSKFKTQLYTVSYLVLFAFLGTLARLGLQAITFYPGAPVTFGVLWANLTGCLFMGFLSEDRIFFRDVIGESQGSKQEKRNEHENDEESPQREKEEDQSAAKKAHNAAKKVTPLYIGLATGLCGTFTSFSSFIRDVYLALSNRLQTPSDHFAEHGTDVTFPRHGGYSFMAVLAVVIVTISGSISALHLGGHLAIALQPYIPSLPSSFTRKFLDPLGVFLAWSCWLGAIILSIWPPDRNSGSPETWRGRAVFSLVFAPLGCLTRFYVSLLLNGKIASFPLGTFVVNIFGTAILGMCWDLQRVPVGGMIGCQVLEGIQDGYCGCLTTVSTWVMELSSLRRTHAYRYGAASLLTALAFLVVIMGSLQWTRDFAALQCVV
jgi:CrcB protein